MQSMVQVLEEGLLEDELYLNKFGRLEVMFWYIFKAKFWLLL
jgi:hypothetical protein